jgi:hypothetical protein
VLDKRILIALDGTLHHSSSDIFCDFCNQKTCRNGETIYSHSFVAASLCSPAHNDVLSLKPEFITPQDGHDKQDCENAAAKRWLNQYGAAYAQEGAVILGDALYANQPLCDSVLSKQLDFIFVCKPDSHKHLYDFIAHAPRETPVLKEKTGALPGQSTQLSFICQVPLNGNSEPLLVNWIGIQVTDKNGKLAYKDAFVTSLEVSPSCRNGTGALENRKRNLQYPQKSRLPP